MFTTILGLIAGGAFLLWMSNRCRGRNAKTSFKFMSWGTWLLLLWFYPIQFFPPVLGLFNSIICLIPSVICFLIAANWMLREMRAQRDAPPGHQLKHLASTQGSRRDH